MKALILAYHHVCPNCHINPEIFDFQMQTIKKKFIPITLEDIIDIIKNKTKFKKDYVVITFDDGWADNFTYAYPILKNHGLRGTIFISTNLISDKKGDYITWDQINLMKPVFQIESHGHSHAYQFRSSKIINPNTLHFDNLKNRLLNYGEGINLKSPIYESGSVLAYPRYYEGKKIVENIDDYKKRVETEIKTSFSIISKKTGRRPKYLAWPFGEYNLIAVKIAQKLNIEACFTTNQGYIFEKDSIYETKRFFPPRNKFAFWIAIKGKIGMQIYLLGINFLSFIKKLIA